MSVAQRRARLAHRHLLAAGRATADPVDVARSLVALHSTDPATVFLSAAARMHTPRVPDIEAALYGPRRLLRMTGMRRTMYVVPVDLAATIQRACTDAIAVRERRLLLQHLTQAGAGDEPWLTEVEEATAAALAARGSALATQLTADVPGLRTQLVLAEGKAYQATQNITTRVLAILSEQGRIVRGRPRGSWISSQYEWHPAERWLPVGTLPPPPEEGGHAVANAARHELAELWLRRYGPATVADLKWWTGWTLTQARAAVATLNAVPVDLDGVEGVALPDDLDPVPDPAPWVALLPSLDPTVMGWVQRDWYLGEHAPALFDRSGNPGPTVWCDGRIVGGWAQRADGRIVVRLLEKVGAAAGRAIETAAEQLGIWLDGVRVTPRFRTPLERELAAK